MWPDQTVPTVSSRALVAACEGLGLDTDELLQSAGISRETLEDPDARLQSDRVSTLWAKAYELSRDPVLSLHAAECCPLGAYKVVDYIGANARELGEGLRYVARYFQWISTAVTLSIDDSGDPVTFDIAGSGAAALSRPYAEFTLAVFVLHIRVGTGVLVPFREVTFTHARPPDTREHERIFGCPVRFETGHNRLCMDRDAWHTPMRSPDEGVLRVLIDHADLLLSRLPRAPDLVERTRRAIGGRLRGADPSIGCVARELGLSERTLQRRLRETGRTYTALVDEVRKATVVAYLHQPDIALAEIAYLLGFADQSAFHRAFKRWTGSTPRQARNDAMRRRPIPTRRSSAS